MKKKFLFVQTFLRLFILVCGWKRFARNVCIMIMTDMTDHPMPAKNPPSSFTCHMTAPGAGHMCNTRPDCEHAATHAQVGMPLSTSLVSLPLFLFSFPFLPLSALTCLSCDGTQAFFRHRWYSDGLRGARSPDFSPSHTPPFPAFTYGLFTIVPPDHLTNVTCEHSCSRLIFKGCF